MEKTSKIVEILTKKVENKQEIGKNDMESVIFSYVRDEISDQEILPFIRAIYNSGLSYQDLFYLTDAMKNSGEVLDLSSLGTVTDKHSTGGVSDTTTIAIVPICACLGTKMLKLSGRSLGFTGGTCDKLECFEGYQTDLPLEKAIELTKQNGGCMITSSKNIAPADKKIYALRDRTGLVDNISLIASSIMSKKLATNANILVLDVKYGNGAFMPNIRQARKLGKVMKKLGELAGKKVKISYGNMDEPLGYNVGPKLETMEAIEVLKNQNPKSKLFKECVHLASLCHSLDKNISYLASKKQVLNVIQNGQALEKLKTMVKSQGGELTLFDETYPAPTLSVMAGTKGKVVHFETKKIGSLVAEMIGHNKDNKNLGIRTFIKLKSKVTESTKLFDIYAKSAQQANEYASKIKECITIK